MVKVFAEKKYLVVDDMKVVRRSIIGSFKKLGIDEENVYQAGNGKEAIDVLEKHVVDMIVTDLNMPEMDGFEFLEFCKSSEKFKDIPIVILTSESDQQNTIKIMDLGIRDYMIKPFQSEKFMKLLMNYFS